MGRPVLLALRVVGVHGITRIHGGQKQKDIKSDPNLRSRLFLGAADEYLLYVFLHFRSQQAHPTTDSLPYHCLQFNRIPLRSIHKLPQNIFIIL